MVENYARSKVPEKTLLGLDNTLRSLDLNLDFQFSTYPHSLVDK